MKEIEIEIEIEIDIDIDSDGDWWNNIPLPIPPAYFGFNDSLPSRVSRKPDNNAFKLIALQHLTPNFVRILPVKFERAQSLPPPTTQEKALHPLQSMSLS